MKQIRDLNRRDFLKWSALGLSAAALGQLQLGFAQGEARELIVVSNAGNPDEGIDATVSLIDPRTLGVLQTLPLAGAFSFPANRWHFGRDVIWSGLPAGPNNAVLGFRLSTGELEVEVGTGSTQNYTELTPDGRYLIVAARFEDRYLKLAADPEAANFGEVVAEFATYEGAEPCDLTIDADGRYAYAPDRGGDTVTVIELESFERVATLPLERFGAAPLEPYMATMSPRGDYLYVENAPVEGGPDAGSESIIDVRDPRAPVEVMRFTQEDGLGEGPITSEFTWDGRYGVVICRDSSELTVIDNDLLEIVRSIQLPEGSNPLTGTFDASGERFFVALPGRDAVAVVSVPDFELVELIPVGQRPMGVVFLETLLPDRPEVYYPAGVALASGREFPANCPDRCCGPV